jgi:hypothetical protein
MKHCARNSILLLSILTVVMLFACTTTPVTVTQSTTPVHDKKIVMNYGPVQGSHRAWSVFGLWMVGRPDIDKAIQDALKQKGGDALINVYCYEKTAWFFFVSMHKVIVEGEAVSFAKETPDTEKDKKPVKGARKNVVEKKDDKKVQEAK